MARGSKFWAWSLVTTIVIFALTAFLGLTTNFVSDAQDLPGWLGWMKEHPYISWGAIGGIVVLALIAKQYLDLGEAPLASTDDVEGLHDRLDMLEVGQLGDDRVVLDRLPPYTRILVAPDEVHEEVWPLIAAFVDPSIDPCVIAREWAASPPVALGELTGRGRLAVAELLLAYGQPDVAADVLSGALGLGVSPRAYWLYRSAQLNADAEGFGPKGEAFLREAIAVDPAYPLALAGLRMHEKQWQQAVDIVDDWTPSNQMEKDARALLIASASIQIGKPDSAILALETVSSDTPSAGLLLQLAQLLRTRSVAGSGDSLWKDAFRAVELSVKARNMRRVWRGDSAEAVACGAEAAIIADSSAQVWTLTRPAPEGEATETEASDSRVLPLAAMGAALTGRLTQAKALRDRTPDGHVRRRIEAEIASAEVGDGPNAAAVAAWRRVLGGAPNDSERLQALRALSLEGATDADVLEALRRTYPQAIAEIQINVHVMTLSGPHSDTKLRELEAKTPLASVRRAELLRKNGDQHRAGEALEDAAARWRNPRLLLLAIDCYIGAGAWSKAESVALQALAEGGMWPGRATVLRRMVEIHASQLNWPKVAAACRSLLEFDERDDDTRWILAFAEFHNGDAKGAWSTLGRLGTARAATPNRAMLLLELARRFASAEDLARIALSQLQEFPDNQEVHAAVIHAITLGADLADLPDDLGEEVSHAWRSFFERYPDSPHIKVHNLDETRPLAEMEPMLRQQAANYHEALKLVREKVLPIGLLDRVVGKPYAAIFAYRPLGFHRASSVLQQEIDAEDLVSRAVADGECIIDASALFTLALIANHASALVAHPRRLGIATAGLVDLLAANDYFQLPAVGTIAFDIERGQAFAERVAEEDRDKQRSWMTAMVNTARSLRQINHPAVAHFESFDDEQDPVWLLGLDAAKDTGAAFWCDDLGLRRLAREYGVQTFGTVSLLRAVQAAGRCEPDDFNSAMRTLVGEYVVDLPFDQQMLESVAAEHGWQPHAVATVLTRPATWIVPEPAVELLRQALQKAKPESYLSWTGAAFHGLKEAAPDMARQNLTSMATAVICEPWAGPDHIRAVAYALARQVPTEANAIVFAALEGLWQQISKKHPPNESLMIYMYLVKNLDDVHRLHATKIVLQQQASSRGTRGA